MNIKIKKPTEVYKVDVLNKSSKVSMHARIGISIGNPRHSGEKFNTLLHWAVEKFSSVEVNIFDLIHAYNIQFTSDCTFRDALNLAHDMGQKWIKDNDTILTAFSSVKTLTYKDITATIPYNERFIQLQSLYEDDAIFKNLIDSEIEAFSARQKNFDNSYSSEKFFQSSKQYIIDELSTMSLLNETEDFVEIYAGRFLKILKNPDRFNVKNLPEGLKNYPLIEVDFIRRKNIALLKKSA